MLEHHINNGDRLRDSGRSRRRHIAVFHLKVIIPAGLTAHLGSSIDIRRKILVRRHSGQIHRLAPVAHPHFGPAHNMPCERLLISWQLIISHAGSHYNHRVLSLLNPGLDNEFRLPADIQRSLAAASKQKRQQQGAAHKRGDSYNNTHEDACAIPDGVVRFHC